MRRWRGLKLRRGVFFTGAAHSSVPAVPPPQPARQAGPRARPMRARHGVFFAVPQAPPSLVPQPIRGSRPRPPARAARGRMLRPVLAQGNQGVPVASFTRQAGSRRLPRLRHGVFYAVPARPAANRGLLMASIV